MRDNSYLLGKYLLVPFFAFKTKSLLHIQLICWSFRRK